MKAKNSNLNFSFWKFISDQTSFIFIFILNTLMLILFFSLFTKVDVPLLYPSLLSGLCIVLYLIWTGFKKFQFFKQVDESKSSPLSTHISSSYEGEYILKSLAETHSEYMREISDLNSQVDLSNKFMYQWIHEMKTPVSVIDLIIQKASVDTDVKAPYISEINQENKKLLNNLDKVLSIIRLQDFSGDYVPSKVSLSDLIKDIINDNKKRFIYSRVFPDVADIPEDCLILTDKKWCRYMLEQFISNGIKYSTSKGKSKKLYFSVESTDTHHILSIRDEGVGIPNYDISRIWEPFFTGTNGRQFKNSTGIGLHICKLISQKLRHELFIESTPEVGTTVSISFLKKADEI